METVVERIDPKNAGEKTRIIKKSGDLSILNPPGVVRA